MTEHSSLWLIALWVRCELPKLAMMHQDLFLTGSACQLNESFCSAWWISREEIVFPFVKLRIWLESLLSNINILQKWKEFYLSLKKKTNKKTPSNTQNQKNPINKISSADIFIILNDIHVKIYII